jgi:hypothetical protein
MAALVPAEALGLHAFIVSLTTTTKTSSEGDNITTIVEPTTLQWSFWGLIVLTVLLFVFAERKKWGDWDWLRMLLPPIPSLPVATCCRWPHALMPYLLS